MDNSKHGARSVDEFCADHRISRAFYYKLRREGRGPREMRVGSRVIVSDEAAADWRRSMESADPWQLIGDVAQRVVSKLEGGGK